MTQKNETSMESKAVTETKTTPVKSAKTQATSPEPEQTKKPGSVQGGVGDLSPELVELVTELRDTVKRLDPRKHTAKTLRRALSNVSDILKDIEALYPQG